MRGAIAVVGIATSLSCEAAAQTINPANITAFQANLEDGQRLVGKGAPLDRAGSGISGSALQISTQQGETDLSLALKFDVDRYEPRETKPGTYRLSSLRLVVTATTPIDGDQKANSKLFSGDSVVTGSKLKLSLVRTSSLQRDGRNSVPVLFDLVKVCIATQLDLWANRGATERGQAEQFRTAIQQKLAAISDPTNIFAVVPLYNAMKNDLQQVIETKAVAKAINDECGDSKVFPDLAVYSQELSKKIRVEQFVTSPMHFMGIDGSLGRESYKNLNRITFKVDDAARTNWEVAAYYGLIGPKLDWSLRGRIVYGQKYETADDVQICRTVTGSTNQECIKGPDGLPARKRLGLASIEGRYRLPLIDAQEIALAPQVTYNFDEKDVGIEVPVYLSPDKDGKLSGGIKFAYASKKDDYGIGLFVGVPFSIFFN